MAEFMILARELLDDTEYDEYAAEIRRIDDEARRRNGTPEERIERITMQFLNRKEVISG